MKTKSSWALRSIYLHSNEVPTFHDVIDETLRGSPQPEELEKVAAQKKREINLTLHNSSPQQDTRQWRLARIRNIYRRILVQHSISCQNLTAA